MTSCPTSGSEGSGPPPAARSSSIFERLHPGVRRWIWRQKWTTLHPIQEKAADIILQGRHDVLICAPTAGGKTEAAFLPLATVVADREATGSAGLGALCVSPLKALINDQHGRLEGLFQAVGSTAHRWHGDVPAAQKKKVRDGAGGLLIITPESLEALFVLRGSRVGPLFANLAALVVDELHAFPGSARGRQLQSLLHRLEHLVGHRLPRIGLSATLGDLRLAAEFLRPRGGEGVQVLEDRSDGRALRLQLRGYVRRPPTVGEPEEYGPDEQEAVESLASPDRGPAAEASAVREEWRIPYDLFRHFRGSDNLVFANSRARVEELTDKLLRESERRKVPNEFMPHHGSLSKEIRETAEKRLKEPNRPTTLICTSTLELGIDVGHVASIGQVGRPQSVAALRQRLGRSGRREGEASVLRIYLAEPELSADMPIEEGLRPGLVETIAVVALMLDRWIEPPALQELHTSTLVQQLLSVVAERGGLHPRQAWCLLCRDGPFATLDPTRFAALLRELGRREILQQAADGDLVLGVRGETLVAHYSFYAAFRTPDEFLLRHAGSPLGSMPTSNPMVLGGLLIFAGRRWRIVGVDPEARVVDLVPASGGRLPLFESGGISVAHEVRVKMRQVYEEDDIPPYLDGGARQLLAEGRESYRHLGLARRALVPAGDEVVLFPWVGDRALQTLTLHLVSVGMEATAHGMAIRVGASSPEQLLEDLRLLVLDGPPDAVALARGIRNRYEEKYDALLPEDLLTEDCAARSLDVGRAWEALNALARATPDTEASTASPTPDPTLR